MTNESLVKKSVANLFQLIAGIDLRENSICHNRDTKDEMCYARDGNVYIRMASVQSLYNESYLRLVVMEYLTNIDQDSVSAGTDF